MDSKCVFALHVMDWGILLHINHACICNIRIEGKLSKGIGLMGERVESERLEV